MEARKGRLALLAILIATAALANGGSEAFAAGKPRPKECRVTLSESQFASLFNHYVPAGSNGRSPAAAILQVDESGEVSRTLFTRNPGVRQAVASTQKIVTAHVAIQRGNLSQKIEFTEDDFLFDSEGDRARYPGTNKEIQVGDKVAMRDLLYTMLVQSSNGAAHAIAHGVAGSTKAFVALMNQAVPELLDDIDVQTYFQNPSGLTDSSARYRFADPSKKQLSTASNMARLMGRIMSGSAFKSAMSKIGLSQYEFRKLGHTSAAGKTIVARIALPGCGEKGVTMAFFGADTDTQFAQFLTLIDELKDDIASHLQ